MTQIGKRTLNFIGSKPRHWGTLPLKALIERKDAKNQSGLPLLSVYRDYGVILKESRDDNFNRPSLDLSRYQVVEMGDLVLNKMKTWQGSLGVSEHKGIVSPAYYVCKVKKERIDRKFLHYLLRSKPYIAIYASLSKGIRPNQWDLSFNDFKQILALIPPTDLQKKIVSYLESRLQLVNALFQKNKKLVKLLEEKRQVIITQAVTKGLDPNVKMKNSGVEWVGKVPKTWNVRRIKTIVKEHYSGIWGGEGIGDSNDILCLRVADFDYNNLCSISPKTIRNVEGKARLKKLLRKRDIVLEKSGGGDKTPVGRQILYDLDIKAVSSNFTQVIRLKNLITAEYYVYFCSAQYSKKINIRSIKQTTGIQNIDINLYFNEPITLPSVEEQKRIANYLNDKTFQIRALISKIKLQNKKLEEYRQALISNAVTGKIKV